MSIFKCLLLIAPFAMVGAASAQPVHLTDAQYIAAVRCQALMASSNLGHENTGAIDALVKAESSLRVPAVYDRGESVRDSTAQAARHAGAYSKAALISERDGLCLSLTGSVAQASAATPTANRTN